MGRIGLLATTVLLSLSACCREINGLNIDTTGTSGSTDTTGATPGTSGSTGTTGGAALVEDIARAEATPAAIDCGTFVVPYAADESQWTSDTGAFEEGVSCVLGAEDAGRPLLMFVTRTGLDFQTHYAYLEGSDGLAWVLWQSHEPNSPAEMGPCVTDVEGVTCTPSLETGVLPPDVGIDDGGIRGLGCPDAGNSVVVSPGDPRCEL